MSHRYIANRFLPDKAIDLMDEAMSRLAMELESIPTEIEKEITENKKELAELRTQWKKEKSGALDVHQLRRQLADVQLEYKNLESHISTEQSQGRLVDEPNSQKLFELDQKRKKLEKQVEEAEQSE